MAAEPKPCPLCGGQAYATHTVNGTQMFRVGCVSCGLELKAAWYRDSDRPTKDILALWNTRVEEPTPPRVPQEERYHRALERIAALEECQCAHDDENCCERVGEPCAVCIASVA